MDLLDGPDTEHSKEMPRGKGTGCPGVSRPGQDRAGMSIPVGRFEVSLALFSPVPFETCFLNVLI